MIKLRAGKIELQYENGFLRQLKVNQIEVIRMIYFAVRDANWENFLVEITNEKILIFEETFQINYDAICSNQNELVFQWKITIEGLKTSEITFEIEGLAMKEFQTNRAGFCLLHPIENLAGQTLEITHSDKTKRPYTFPKYISPHQPFMDVMGMKWELLGNEFELNFQGDIFETEDQRNWGDASYKTYCTPLSLPFPRTIKKGDLVHQKISFKANIIHERSEILEKKSNQNKSFFQIGICASSDVLNLSHTVIEKIKLLNLSHYRIEICPSEKNWEDTFLRQVEEAKILELSLEIVLILSKNFTEEFAKLLNNLELKTLNIKYLTVLSMDELVTNNALLNFIPTIKKHIKNTKIGIGTNYNFTELNRERFDPNYADFIALSFAPQEHANDDLTIMENAETVKYMVESIEEIYEKPLHFSPIMLKRRFNPYATDKSAINIPFDDQIDSRQKNDFLAKWTAMIIENLIKSGIESATFFQTAGELGIMDEAGNEYPVYNEIKNYGNRNK